MEYFCHRDKVIAISMFAVQADVDYGNNNLHIENIYVYMCINIKWLYLYVHIYTNIYTNYY